MRIITRTRLREFWERQPDSEESLRSWYAIADHAQWKSPSDVKTAFRTADILRSGRVVFNIRDNRYRLVVKFHYNSGMAYIRFVGTHREYGAIDANRV